MRPDALISAAGHMRPGAVRAASAAMPSTRTGRSAMPAAATAAITAACTVAAAASAAMTAATTAAVSARTASAAATRSAGRSRLGKGGSSQKKDGDKYRDVFAHGGGLILIVG